LEVRATARHQKMLKYLFLGTRIFVWLTVFPFLWCTFNRVQEIAVFSSAVSHILNVSNFVTADLYLQHMNIKSGSLYKKNTFGRWVYSIEGYLACIMGWPL
jgi:hypothetical protein